MTYYDTLTYLTTELPKISSNPGVIGYDQVQIQTLATPTMPKVTSPTNPKVIYLFMQGVSGSSIREVFDTCAGVQLWIKETALQGVDHKTDFLISSYFVSFDL